MQLHPGKGRRKFTIPASQPSHHTSLRLLWWTWWVLTPWKRLHAAISGQATAGWGMQLAMSPFGRAHFHHVSLTEQLPALYFGTSHTYLNNFNLLSRAFPKAGIRWWVRFIAVGISCLKILFSHRQTFHASVLPHLLSLPAGLKREGRIWLNPGIMLVAV